MEPLSRIKCYPLRTTKPMWNIPLVTKHVCNENCSVVVSSSSNGGRLEFSENADFVDGRCGEYGNLVYTPVPIASFTLASSHLFYKDLKVIPDSTFKVYIYYPLSNVMEATILSPSTNGFTLGNLLQAIKMLYEFIYQEEENTADAFVFHLKKRCTDCGNMDLVKHVKTLREEEVEAVSEETCAICFEVYKESSKSVVKLCCGHHFHGECMKIWSEKSCTCPVCRSGVYRCDRCDGKGIIYYTYTGAVIPLEDRLSNNLLRNSSNGIFGIHTYGIEDLVIEKLFYDRTSRRLFVDVSNF